MNEELIKRNLEITNRYYKEFIINYKEFFIIKYKKADFYLRIKFIITLNIILNKNIDLKEKIINHLYSFSYDYFERNDQTENILMIIKNNEYNEEYNKLYNLLKQIKDN